MSLTSARVLAVAVAPLVVAAATIGGLTAATGPAGAAASTHNTQTTGSAGQQGPLTLVSQSYNVSGLSKFDLEVAVGAAESSAAQGTAFDVAIYGSLSTRSGFEQTLGSSGPPSERLGSTGEVPLSSVPQVAGSGTQRHYALSIGLETGADTSPSPFSGQAVDLDCTTGDCGGVYPVVVSLVDQASGRTVSHFTTFLDYVEPVATTRLRVATVLPVEAPVVPGSGSSAGRPQPLAPAQLEQLEGTVGAIASSARSQVPVTLQALPETLQRLAASGRRGLATRQTLQLLAGDGVDEFLQEPYVAVRPDSLELSGLGDELQAELTRGAKVLDGLRLDPTSGIWASELPVGNGTRAAVSALGAQELVVPASSLAPQAERLTPANPFELSLGHGVEVPTAETDPEITAQFDADPSDPALAAYQLLADLDLTYEELPNVVRGIVAMPPARWDANPTFLQVLLRGLEPANAPSLQPVTLSQLFAQVPRQPASSDQPAVRQLAGGGTTLPASFVTSLRGQRARWSAFGSAAPEAGRLLTRLNDALLVSEAWGLDAKGKAESLAGFSDALQAQLDQVRLATDRTITVTSRTAELPITILSSAPYRIVAVLSASSDKLQFPGNDSTRQVIIDRSTTPERIQVVVRTSGDLPVTVDVSSPTGGLVIVHGQLTVRSTATSLVGIVLTLLALLVLLIWWARSSLAKRRQRPTDGGGPGGGAGDGSSPSLSSPAAPPAAPPATPVSSSVPGQ